MINKEKLIKKYQNLVELQNTLLNESREAEKELDKHSGYPHEEYCELEKKWMSYDTQTIILKRKIYDEFLLELKFTNPQNIKEEKQKQIVCPHCEETDEDIISHNDSGWDHVCNSCGGGFDLNSEVHE